MKVQYISQNSLNNGILKLFYGLFVLLSFLFIGCESCALFKSTSSSHGSLELDQSFLCSDSGDDDGDNNDPSHNSNSNLSNIALSSPPIFFLAHGLSDTSDCFKFLEQELPKRLLGALVILAESVTGKTCSLSIDEQIEVCRKEFLEAMKKIPDAKARPIVLGGHSQGGLRMAGLAIELIEEGYKVELITMNTLFEGAPGLRFENKESIKQYISGQFSSWSFKPEQLISSIVSLLNETPFFGKDGQPSQEPGVQDLHPNSPFLSKLSAKLTKANFPILAIAGHAPRINIHDMFKLFHLDIPEFFSDKLLADRLNKIFANIIVGTKYSDRRHDMALPVATQLGKKIFSENKNVRQVVINGTVHCHPSDSDRFTGLVRGTLYSYKTVHEIEKFLKRKC